RPASPPAHRPFRSVWVVSIAVSLAGRGRSAVSWLSRGGAGVRRRAQPHDEARLLLQHDRVVLLKVLAEAGVVVEPPPCCLRDQQELGALAAQTFEVGNGLAAVRRVSGVPPLRRAGEVPRGAGAEVQQRVVALADDQGEGGRRQGGPCG